ncbi:MAG: NAD(P)H-binding protein [Chitinophagales bacterium]|nr:NAD(P)H-binding protein [Chitinophagales bacterium]
MNEAIIVGGTGLVGRHVIKILLEDNFFNKVYILNRRSIGYSHPKIQEIIIDFEDISSSIQNLLPTHAFCCLGTTIKKAGSQEAFRKVDYQYVLNFAKAVKNIGCQNLSVITALGTNKPSRIFYNQVKYEIAEALKDLQLRQLNILQPSLLLGEREEARLGEEVSQKFFSLTKKLWVGPLKNVAGITGKQVAKAMVEISKENHPGFHTFPSGNLQTY